MIHILAIGINKEFIHKLEQEIKDIEIVLVPHFVKAIGYLYSNHFDLIFYNVCKVKRYQVLNF